ncbi:MAG: bifunctional diguanylate cyclase/phosphodiesterase, partial [Gemmatimonadetes bacterium]|nr:bifunctional diguanylate cyclase/phosphodiesterase [Gemmatimonadota bacterium]
LPNRDRVRALLEEAVTGAVASRHEGALLYVDLDRLALVNARYGNVVGDQLLHAIGRALRRAVRSTDVVARMMGDEFAVLLRESDGEAARSSAGDLVQRASQVEIMVGEERVSTTASAGVVVFPMDDASADDLITCAETAARQAKEAGGNRVRLYQPSERAREALSDLQRARLLIEDALEHDRLRLVRQPIVTVSTGEVAMYEVLSRLRDQDGTVRSPAEFIPQAEALDLIEGLDREVVAQACHRWRRYADAGLELRLSLNVSGRSIGTGMMLHICEQAKQWRVPHEAITVEVTETAVAREGGSVRAFFQALRERGFKVAIDDFGSGNTTLLELRDVPLDYLKLDGSLIRKLPSSQIDREFVRAFSGIARVMGVAAVAEHVEDAETMGLLAEYGVGYAQGYHVGRPEEFPPSPNAPGRGLPGPTGV